MPEKNAGKVLDEATDNAAANLKGIGFSDTDEVLGQFNAKIDQASTLASARAREGKHEEKSTV